MRDRLSALSEASAKGASSDRRVQRSRAALRTAITELTLERGYTHLAPNDVAERADVGRSTFYTHFSGLDDLLAHSLDRHLSTLAECTLKPDLEPALVQLLEHFWEQRAVARTILREAALAAISRLLAEKIEARLLELGRTRKSRATLPTRLIAIQISAGQLAALGAWLAGRAPASPVEVSQLLRATTHAAAGAIF